MLRSTSETMSAAIGGSDSISVVPFDSTYKKPDEFSERNARNTQLILKYESYLDKVIDPSSGSYYIENLTNSVIEATWNDFLKIEEMGGIIKAVESGFIKEDIEKTCRQRDMDIAMRKQIILGANQHPNQEEKMLDNFQPRSALNCLGDIKPYRGAHALEAIRMATESYVNNGNKKPTVFLLTFGNHVIRKARATFTVNFFGCAGYEIIDNTCFKTIEDGVTAAIKSGSEIVVFCSSDDEYVMNVSEACRIFKTHNSEAILVIAGNPQNAIDKLKNAGISDFIHIGSNLVASLLKYQRLLGII